jgi:hypothetical protein
MPIHIHPITTKDAEVTMQQNSNAEYEYYNNIQNIKDIPKPRRQLDECIVEDASDEENEDDISTVSSLPDFTPIEMFPTVEEASSTTTNMHRQKTLKEEDAKKDEEANNINPKKRGRPKSGRATYNKKGKLNLEPF